MFVSLCLSLSLASLNTPSPQFSKIGKVMRHIAALTADKVPRDDEFKFRDRAKVLVDKWQRILSSSKTTNSVTTPGLAEGTAKMDLNGEAEAEAEAAKEEEALADVTMSEAGA